MLHSLCVILLFQESFVGKYEASAEHLTPPATPYCLRPRRGRSADHPPPQILKKRAPEEAPHPMPSPLPWSQRPLSDHFLALSKVLGQKRSSFSNREQQLKHLIAQGCRLNATHFLPLPPYLIGNTTHYETNVLLEKTLAHPKLLALLLRLGFDPNSTAGGCCLLSDVVFFSDALEPLEQLLKAGANPNPPDGVSPLEQVFSNTIHEAVLAQAALLLRYGASWSPYFTERPDMNPLLALTDARGCSAADRHLIASSALAYHPEWKDAPDHEGRSPGERALGTGLEPPLADLVRLLWDHRASHLDTLIQQRVTTWRMMRPMMDPKEHAAGEEVLQELLTHVCEAAQAPPASCGFKP